MRHGSSGSLAELSEGRACYGEPFDTANGKRETVMPDRSKRAKAQSKKTRRSGPTRPAVKRAPEHGLAKSKAAPREVRKTASAAPKFRKGTKQGMLVELLRRSEGATIDQIADATGWQHHTVRGAISDALKKKLGLAVTSEKPEKGKRIYRII